MEFTIRSVATLSRILHDSIMAGRTGSKASKSKDYSAPVLSEHDQWICEECHRTLSDLFTAEIGDYAWTRFNASLATGDLRSYKVRIVLLRIRDFLKGTDVYDDFLANLDDIVTRAEEAAGCRYHHIGPRRLSLAEQERQRERLIAQGVTPPEKIDHRRRDAHRLDRNAASPAEPLPATPQSSATPATSEASVVSPTPPTPPKPAKKTPKKRAPSGRRRRNLRDEVASMDLDDVYDEVMRAEAAGTVYDADDDFPSLPGRDPVWGFDIGDAERDGNGGYGDYGYDRGDYNNDGGDDW